MSPNSTNLNDGSDVPKWIYNIPTLDVGLDMVTICSEGGSESYEESVELV